MRNTKSQVYSTLQLAQPEDCCLGWEFVTWKNHSARFLENNLLLKYFILASHPEIEFSPAGPGIVWGLAVLPGLDHTIKISGNLESFVVMII